MITHIDKKTAIPRYKTLLYNSFIIIALANICPECGGSLNMDSVTKNFICRGCGLYAPREKFEELREKLNKSEERNEKKEEYLDWWQSSKKDKKNQF
ncbi:MAG: hypothetical protein H0X50_05640 [Nitrosopumilus sp.]|nr:hypothetical protein [Nitrosopumilus sp.]